MEGEGEGSTHDPKVGLETNPLPLGKYPGCNLAMFFNTSLVKMSSIHWKLTGS